MKRTPALIPALLTMLFFVPEPACRGSNPAPEPAGAAPEDGPVISIGDWRKRTDRLIEEMLGTIRRRDLQAFSKELAEHISRRALPADRYLEELNSLLTMAPAGVVLNALVETLIRDGSRRALEILFDALTRKDFSNLKGRRLGEGQREMRWRVIEVYIMRLADRVYATRHDESPIELTVSPTERSSLTERLVEELASENRRRVRCAAYLLGGMRARSAAPALLEAAKRLRDTGPTLAMLVEAIGRTEPTVAGDFIGEALDHRNELVRLAAIPVLGYLEGERYEDLIEEHMSSKEWKDRRAAIEACSNRRDTFAADLLIRRYPKETLRLQYDILQVLLDITGGVLPPDPKEWSRWWRQARKDFKAVAPGKGGKGDRRTKVIMPSYFGVEIWSSQLAILLDTSSSMSTKNVTLGLSGVGVSARKEKGSPLEIAKRQINRLLSVLPTPTLFNLVTYGDRVAAMSEKLIRASRSNKRKAAVYVKRLKAVGGTNIYGALIAGLKDGRVDTIYILSDGQPTDGLRTEPDDILEAIQKINRFRKTRINTIQLGRHSELMEELADSSGGTYKLYEFAEEGGEINP